MQTLLETPLTRKPTAYYAQYLGLAGVLTKPADRVLFLEPHSGAVITLSDVEVVRDVVVQGAVAAAMAQFVEDQVRGGYAAICTSRAQREV
jgi:hypothetical protein